ncbi:MAG TPA: diguanylate cyclase [Thermoanaerobaculia bacterium]|nr:diguanylate cyclase [Thermoanaerobaculia bacterium]
MTTIVLLLLFFVAIAAVLAFDRARTETARLRLLIEMSGLLQVSGSFSEAAEIVPVYGRHLFPRAAGALRLRRPSGIFDVVASWGDTPEKETDAISIPLHACGEPVGGLTLHAAAGSSLSNDTEFFAHAFADQIALALAKVQQQETLRTRAVRDALTGLFNRRYVDEALPRALARRNARVGVMLMDVDRFKAFNDTWGHGAGDALLVQVGRMMQNVFAEEDIVARYGGEEFIVVMPDATPEMMQDRAELLRHCISELRVHHEGHLLATVTASVGIALSPIHATNAHALVTAADRALYAAKSGGRDRVCTPPPRIAAA